jgi:hypothetical protein
VRRFALAPIIALLLIALVSGGSLAARPAPTIVARAAAGVAGGSIHVMAKVKHPVRPNTFSATAVAHFASGDVDVTLRRAGKSFTAVGRVPVPDDASPGPVTIDVTVSYAGADTTLTVNGKVQPPSD